METKLRPDAWMPDRDRSKPKPTVTCDYCSRGVRGQARKRALHFGGPAFCSKCERQKRDR